MSGTASQRRGVGDGAENMQTVGPAGFMAEPQPPAKVAAKYSGAAL